jgi:hypothetical protein
VKWINLLVRCPRRPLGIFVLLVLFFLTKRPIVSILKRKCTGYILNFENRFCIFCTDQILLCPWGAAGFSVYKIAFASGGGASPCSPVFPIGKKFRRHFWAYIGCSVYKWAFASVVGKELNFLLHSPLYLCKRVANQKKISPLLLELSFKKSAFQKTALFSLS